MLAAMTRAEPVFTDHGQEPARLMRARLSIVMLAFPFADGPEIKPASGVLLCRSERHPAESR